MRSNYVLRTWMILDAQNIRCSSACMPNFCSLPPVSADLVNPPPPFCLLFAHDKDMGDLAHSL